MRKLLLFSIALLFFISAEAQDQLYKVKLIRAAPGELLTVIDMIKSDMKSYESFGIEQPYLMRHSQGDQWDLMMMYPVTSLENYYSDGSQSKLNGSKTLGKTFGDSFYNMISYHEESFVMGPDKESFHNWFRQYNYYHIEIFTSLAGKQNELKKQREMENVFLNELKRRPNFIFTKVTGASWDIFTIGYYDDIVDYATAGDLPIEQEDAAAKKAGFESVYTIGSYLRALLLEHHDTLAGAVRAD